MNDHPIRSREAAASSADRPSGRMTEGDRDAPRPACPVCGGTLVDIKQKRVCARCRTICETCCEGGRG